jgi:uncharacterized membrane protein
LVFTRCTPLVDDHYTVFAMNLHITTPLNAPDPAAVELAAPLRWLRLGWSDFMRNPLPGLVHGALLALFGWVLLWLARDRFWLLAGAFSGFLMVAPILTTGLYQVSRTCATGHCVGMAEVLNLWRSGDGRLIRFGLLLSLAGTGWVTTSAALITLLSSVPIHNPADFLQHVVIAKSSWLFELWMVLGALLAAPVFASSVVAIPMLVDTRVTVLQAVHASWRAVATNPGPLAVWAFLILALSVAGMLTGLLGLLVTIPVLAHASWHAYQELTSAH